MIHLTDLCRSASCIGISGHTKPDGDCVGAVMGLWQFLKKVFPDKTIEVRLEEPAAIYGEIPGVKEIVGSKQEEAAGGGETVYDIFFVLDSVPDRIGTAEQYYKSAKKKVNIDHHITNPGCGDLFWVEPSASSASEMVYELIREADPKGRYMDAALAKTLYLGIIQDCGVFQYSNTSPKTLRLAAELIGYGFDFPRLIDETFYEKTLTQNKMLGYALSVSETALGGSFIYSIVAKEDIKKLHAGDHDFEGIVNQLRYTRGVNTAAFLHQLFDGSYKVSLRSDGSVDVARVAAHFGGGGHVRAAGCTLNGSREEMIAALSKAVAENTITPVV